MARTKIDYGIDLGTTNSAIAKMQDGKVEIIKSLPDRKKETTPSCISFRQNGNMNIGDGAYLLYKTDSVKAISRNQPLNVFVEFKRTMGSDKKYHSTYTGNDYSSEELSAEVLKRLKEYAQDDNINAAVITVPAAFKANQIDATRKAAALAGLYQVEVLQEPVAASMAYGLNSDKKNGFWLVFDYGGGTFDSALLKVEDGIMKVVDTEGDNYLGGKDLDNAIVDHIIIPHIQKNFVIEEILEDAVKKAEYRGALKFFAEEIKNNLSFNDSHNIYVDPGDCGQDDEGEEIEIDLTVTQAQLKIVLEPVFQKAINCCITLLKRNNLNNSSLDSLILVGGPTLSPALREMLRLQICEPDTSVDPMTVVANGAALYASTVDLSDKIKDQARDKTKIQLEIANESATVETESFVPIKILTDKTESVIPDKIFVEIKRGDNAWSSGKVEINAIGEVIDVQLEEGKNNNFIVTIYDDKSNLLESEPQSFNIIQGSVVGKTTLPFNVGIEIQKRDSDKIVFETLKGLEKNKSLPAEGVRNNLKTQKQIRPGMENDYLEISIYQGEHGADGTRAIFNNHVNTIYITGNDVPGLLPENSDVDITLKIDTSQKITGKVFFPYLEFEYEFECKTKIDSIQTEWLENEFKKGLKSVNNLKSKGITSDELLKSEKEIIENKELFESAREDTDTKQQALSNLRRSLKVVDRLIGDREWPELEKELKEAFHKLEEVNREKGNEQTTQMVGRIRPDVEQAIREKDKKNTPTLIETINSMSFELDRLENLMGFIFYLENNFESIPWRNRNAAHSSINQGKGIIYENPSVANLQPIVNDLYDNARFDEKGPDEEGGYGPTEILKG